jgi:hypothetical protein
MKGHETKELDELEELNIELMDTLVAASLGLLKYCRDRQIQVTGLDGLASLIARAGRICEEIGEPYHKNPIVGRKRNEHVACILLPIIFLSLALNASHYTVQVSSPTETLQVKLPTVKATLPFHR